MLGAKESVAQLPVIRHEKKALGIAVKSADGEKHVALLLGEKVHHGLMPLVAPCRDTTSRLIEHIILSHVSSLRVFASR